MDIIQSRAMGKHLLEEDDARVVLYSAKDAPTKPTDAAIAWNDLTIDIDGANYVMSSSYRHKKARIFRRKENNA